MAHKCEYKKSNCNIAVVDDLMTRSFAFRCAKIVKKSHDLPALFARFPLLREVDQVSCILISFPCNYLQSSFVDSRKKRSVKDDKLRMTYVDTWKNLALKIISQTKIEATQQQSSSPSSGGEDP